MLRWLIADAFHKRVKKLRSSDPELRQLFQQLRVQSGNAAEQKKLQNSRLQEWVAANLTVRMTDSVSGQNLPIFEPRIVAQYVDAHRKLMPWFI